MLNIIDIHSEENNLSINLKKTECMVVSKKRNVIDCGITLKENSIKQVENFKHLGTWITNDGKFRQGSKGQNCHGKGYILQTN